LYVTGPLTDTLAIGVSGIYNSKDDYYKPSVDSPLKDVPGYRDRGYRVRLKWTPSEWFEAMASYYYISTKGPGTNIYVPLSPFALGKALGIQKPKKPYTDTGNVNPKGSDKTHIATLHMNFHFTPLDVTSITG